MAQECSIVESKLMPIELEMATELFINFSMFVILKNVSCLGLNTYLTLASYIENITYLFF